MTALIDLYGGDHAMVVRRITKQYGIAVLDVAAGFSNPHRLRRERIAQRLRLYRDDARVDFERLIGQVFETDTVRDQRKIMIDVASEQNVTRRIVDEVASLYDQPAVRTLKDRNEQFHDLATALELDEVSQEAQHLLFLCNETLLWRTKNDEGDSLGIITPDLFDAIPNPRSRLQAAGFLIDTCPVYQPDLGVQKNLPHYEVWDDTYLYRLSADGVMVTERGEYTDRPEEHGLGRVPGALLHRRKPVDRILDDRAGRDITSAHLGVGLVEVMVMRLSKSQGERQPILSGNLAQMAMGQSMDGERPLILPPEVVASMLDSKTDPEHYLKVKKDKITSVAQTYGMSYEQFTYADTADTGSGKAFQTRRLKLTELRSEQRRRAMVNEKLVISLMGFDPVGVAIDFSEQAVPQDAAEEIDLLKEKMRLGLDSPVRYKMRKNPDLDEKAAIAEIRRDLSEYSLVVLEVRALNMPAGADADNPGQSPEQNGAMGGRPSANDSAAADAVTKNPASGAKTQLPRERAATAA